ncbi:hypothetical protein V3C99_018583 [Haemonchus contortus]|uniref:Uncharacterized protein n=1 Tax=Haemonchus contortus TaxID=6289 RepID=A0A7I4Z1L6_HAECO
MDMGVTWWAARDEIDHIIIINRKFCLSDVAVVSKLYTGSDRRLPRARPRFSVRGEGAANFRKQSPKTVVNWNHLLHERVCGEIPSATTSTKSTAGSSNIFTIVLGEQRVSKVSREFFLWRLLS